MRRNRLTILTAVKHAFAGMFTVEITKALNRQSPSSLRALPSASRAAAADGNADDASLKAAAKQAAAGGGRYQAVLKSLAWGRSKTASPAVGGGHEARAAQLVFADSAMDSAALEPLLAIINCEFQVCAVRNVCSMLTCLKFYHASAGLGFQAVQ